jgi:hypothetical protein
MSRPMYLEFDISYKHDDDACNEMYGFWYVQF